MALPTPIPKIDSTFFIVNYDERVCNGGDHFYDDNREKLFHSYDDIITWLKEYDRSVNWIKQVDKHITMDVKKICREVITLKKKQKLMDAQEDIQKKLAKINSALVSH